MQLFASTNEMESENYCLNPAEELLAYSQSRLESLFCSAVVCPLFSNVGCPGSNPTGIRQLKSFFILIAGKLSLLFMSRFLRIPFWNHLFNISDTDFIQKKYGRFQQKKAWLLFLTTFALLRIQAGSVPKGDVWFDSISMLLI